MDWMAVCGQQSANTWRLGQPLHQKAGVTHAAQFEAERQEEQQEVHLFLLSSSKQPLIQCASHPQVTFPDHQRVGWLNTVMAQLYPYAAKYGQTWARSCTCNLQAGHSCCHVPSGLDACMVLRCQMAAHLPASQGAHRAPHGPCLPGLSHAPACRLSWLPR